MEVERKFVSFETSLNTLKKCVKEKDLHIEKLENEITDKSREMGTKVKCSKCDFEGNTKHGLKIHMARKHTVTIDSNSTKCELCERTFENASELKIHMKTHSFKKANFKCADCEFVGTTEETMEVHSGKTHTDTFECGLCYYQAETQEKMDIHLFTCEVYNCSQCDYRERSLSTFKKHVQKEHHYNKLSKFSYYKMDRTHTNEVCLGIIFGVIFN